MASIVGISAMGMLLILCRLNEESLSRSISTRRLNVTHISL